MNKIDSNEPVSVFERGASEVAGRLSISNIPLSCALRTIYRWPQERREGVLIEMSDCTLPWADIDDLYRQLYHPSL
jgi:hypothetical protein